MIAVPAESYSADGCGSEGDPSNLNRARRGEDVDAKQSRITHTFHESDYAYAQLNNV